MDAIEPAQRGPHEAVDVRISMNRKKNLDVVEASDDLFDRLADLPQPRTMILAPMRGDQNDARLPEIESTHHVVLRLVDAQLPQSVHHGVSSDPHAAPA